MPDEAYHTFSNRTPQSDQSINVKQSEVERSSKINSKVFSNYGHELVEKSGYQGEMEEDFDILDETGKYTEEGYDSIPSNPDFYKDKNSRLYSGIGTDGKASNNSSKITKGRDGKGMKNESNLFGVSDNLEEESFTVSTGTQNVNAIFKNRLGNNKAPQEKDRYVYE